VGVGKGGDDLGWVHGGRRQEEMETPVNKTRILISAICLASRAPHGPGIERTRR
jgi:hypothetical protein